MKSGTEDKLKFKRLQRVLRLPRWSARGLLDTLWKFAADNAAPGDIGRFTDEEIAIGIDWAEQVSPEELIGILVLTKWLDRTPDAQGRLWIHDWPEHCEDRVHKHLARRGEIFADGTLPSMSRLTKVERKKAVNIYTKKYGREAIKNGCVSADVLWTPSTDAQNTPQPEPVPVPVPVPSHTSTVTSTKPCNSSINGQSARSALAKSRGVAAADRSGPAVAADRKPDRTDQKSQTIGEQMEEAATIAKDIFRRMKFRGRDGGYLWQVAIAVAQGELAESVATSAANGVAEISKTEDVPNKVGYFRRTIERDCGERGIPIKRILGMIKLPDGINYGPPRVAENVMAAIQREAAAAT